MNILWITNYPSPYRVSFFNELGRECSLSVVFENTVEQQGHRNKEWFNTNYNGFNAIFLRQEGIRKKLKETQRIIALNKFDFIVLADFSTPVSILLSHWLRIKRRSYVISIDGAYFRNSNVVKDIVKRTVIKNAQFLFSSSDTSDQYLIHYGAKKENIYRYNFTSLCNKDLLTKPISADEKMAIRTKLGMNSRLSALLVSRFVYIKGIDFVLKNAKHFEKSVDFYIAGDKPTDEYIKIVNDNKLTNVHFIGFKKKEELKEYYIASDIFVFPTRYDPWGLVVNEAMAYGLPILSTDKSSAAMHFIKNGYNGYVYPVDNQSEFLKCLENLCDNQNKLREMGNINFSIIKDYTIEVMAQQHKEVFKGYMVKK